VPDQETPCAERLRLSEAVVKAVNVVYVAKSVKDKAFARAAEREAVKALEEHRKQHNC
jgi:predicted hydrolase (HD superfamily)